MHKILIFQYLFSSDKCGLSSKAASYSLRSVQHETTSSFLLKGELDSGLVGTEFTSIYDRSILVQFQNGSNMTCSNVCSTFNKNVLLTTNVKNFKST